MKKSLKIVLISLAVLALLIFLLFFAPKPIRIIFRVIVILLLFIILAVLLCPIKYSADAAFDGKPDVHVLIKLLLFISVPVDYNEQGVSFAVKIFGFRLIPRKGKKQKETSSGDEQPRVSENETAAADEKSGSADVKKDSAGDEAGAESGKAGESETGKKPDEPEKKDGESSGAGKEGQAGGEKEDSAGADKKEEKDSEDEDEEDEESEKQSFLDRIGDKADKFAGIWDNTMGALNDEEIQLNLFLKRRSTRHSLEWTKELLFDLCDHVRPRKLSGELEFGLDDPSLTGYISALASFFYDFYSETFDFCPCFEGNTIKGRVEFAGRFVLGYILIKCVWLYLGRPFKFLFSKLGLFHAEPYGGREFRMFIKNVLVLKNDTMKNIAKIKDGITNYG